MDGGRVGGKREREDLACRLEVWVIIDIIHVHQAHICLFYSSTMINKYTFRFLLPTMCGIDTVLILHNGIASEYLWSNSAVTPPWFMWKSIPSNTLSILRRSAKYMLCIPMLWFLHQEWDHLLTPYSKNTYKPFWWFYIIPAFEEPFPDPDNIEHIV